MSSIGRSAIHGWNIGRTMPTEASCDASGAYSAAGHTETATYEETSARAAVTDTLPEMSPNYLGREMGLPLLHSLILVKEQWHPRVDHIQDLSIIISIRDPTRGYVKNQQAHHLRPMRWREDV